MAPISAINPKIATAGIVESTARLLLVLMRYRTFAQFAALAWVFWAATILLSFFRGSQAN